MANTYDEADTVRCWGIFRVAGVPTDPTTITVKVKDPTPTTSTYVYNTNVEVIKASTGVYYIDVDVAANHGQWYYRWIGTGAAKAAGWKPFTVGTSPV